jgi:hypothetical protein
MAIGPLARIIAQVVTVILPVAFKSFKDAYKQIASQHRVINEQTLFSKNMNLKRDMNFDEAKKILSLEEPISNEMIMEKYEKYFKANSPESGGSKYLQDKISAAKEVIMKTKK